MSSWFNVSSYLKNEFSLAAGYLLLISSYEYLFVLVLMRQIPTVATCTFHQSAVVA